MLQIGIRLHDVNSGLADELQTLEARAAKAQKEGFCCVHLAPQKVMHAKRLSLRESSRASG